MILVPALLENKKTESNKTSESSMQRENEHWLDLVGIAFEEIGQRILRAKQELMSADPDLQIDRISLDETTITSIDFGVRVIHDEDVLIDEPLPRIPLSTQLAEARATIDVQRQLVYDFDYEIDIDDGH